MKNEKLLSYISLIIGLIFLLIAYALPRMVDKMYWLNGILHLFIMSIAIIGIILIFITTYINPKIGFLPLIIILYLAMSNIGVTSRHSTDADNGLVAKSYRGWPFHVYENTTRIDTDQKILFNEEYQYKGMALNFILSAGITFSVCFRKMKK